MLCTDQHAEVPDFVKCDLFMEFVDCVRLNIAGSRLLGSISLLITRSGQ